MRFPQQVSHRLRALASWLRVRVNSAVGAQGAGQTGLSRLIELQALNAAGDAAVAVSLAGTLFFQVPTDQARSQVGLFLALTMLPFAVLAPLIGPLLDRFAYGRRWAIGTTTAVRAFLCWALADAVAGESAWLFPTALGCLIGSKAYAVTRAAAVPRLTPPALTLVKANGRVLLAGLVGAGLSAGVAGLFALWGSEWGLRYAFVVFVVATIWAIRLPAEVDSQQGEEPTLNWRNGWRSQALPAPVAFALRANCAPRWLSGFLTIFLAFLIREHNFNVSADLVLALVVGAAGLGNAAGIGFAALGRSLPPSRVVVTAVLLDLAVCLLAAWQDGVWPLVLLGLTAGLTQSLGKLALDSAIQGEVPDRIRTSTFARSDTTLQLAWVVGGLVGIVLPAWRVASLLIAAAMLTLWIVLALVLPAARQRSS